MANEEQLHILLQGVHRWNTQRQEHPEEAIDLSKANLSGVDLSGADLSGADLSGQDLSGADLSGQDLSGANLSEVNLRGANLSEVNLSFTDLSGQDLGGANLSEANLRGADLRGANLRGVDLIWADLNEANLSKTNLSKTNLKGVDFRLANLIEATLDGAILTEAYLWETQRAGWSIQGIVCEAAYWNRDGKERTVYKVGEFERLYADKMKIVLHYEGGISPIEVATIPALIQQIEATHPGYIFRLQSVHDAPGGATVTLVVEEGGGHNPDELQTLKTEIETVSQRVIHSQRVLLEERRVREQIETELQIVHNKIIPRIGRAINIGLIERVGHLSGENAELHFTRNDLAMEVRMGDQFSHIGSGATIVNRSIVPNAFNKVKTQYDEETAQALERVEAEINKSGNQAAATTFNAFNQELQKAEPQKPVLQALWQGVVMALPSITQLADIADKIAKLCSS